MFSIIVSLSFPLFVCLLLSCSFPASHLCFASRVAVIRGSVVLQDGSPLVGVNVTFPQHPEYGYTISRQDGRYKHKQKIDTLYVCVSSLPPVLLCFTLIQL